jgi:hypothetical protein
MTMLPGDVFVDRMFKTGLLLNRSVLLNAVVGSEGVQFGLQLAD